MLILSKIFVAYYSSIIMFAGYHNKRIYYGEFLS